MRARLGISVAIQVDPDVLLIDEVLGVGDQEFRIKSNTSLKTHMRSEKSVILVSHSVPTFNQLCDRVLWIEDGIVKMLDTTNVVLKHYTRPTDQPRLRRNLINWTARKTHLWVEPPTLISCQIFRFSVARFSGKETRHTIVCHGCFAVLYYGLQITILTDQNCPPSICAEETLCCHIGRIFDD
jgi:ABC-type sulfate/molybdate transport systems ATPase subunit